MDPLTAPSVLDRSGNPPAAADVGGRPPIRLLEALRQRLNIEVVDSCEGFRFLKEAAAAACWSKRFTRPVARACCPPGGTAQCLDFVGLGERGRQGPTTLGQAGQPGGCAAVTAVTGSPPADTFRAAAVRFFFRRSRVWESAARAR